jgi:hypothetical protein
VRKHGAEIKRWRSVVRVSDAPIPVTLLTLVTLQSPYRSGRKVSAVSAVSALRGQRAVTDVLNALPPPAMATQPVVRAELNAARFAAARSLPEDQIAHLILLARIDRTRDAPTAARMRDSVLPRP